MRDERLETSPPRGGPEGGAIPIQEGLVGSSAAQWGMIPEVLSTSRTSSTTVKQASLALLLALAVLPGTAEATSGSDCTYNQFPIFFVDAQGNPHSGQDSEVYLALSSDTPSGTYWVQVTNSELSVVLAATEQLDRRFEILNDNGTILVTRQTSAVGLPEPGLGLGGIGQSIPLFPLVAPPAGSQACSFKAIIGNLYDVWWSAAAAPLGSPWGVRADGGSGADCVLFSFGHFQIGDGSGTTVSGVVFDDLDRDGQQGAGEPGKAGILVHLSLGDTLAASTVTDSQGAYSFSGLTMGVYEVAVSGPSGSEYRASTPTSFEVDASGCTPATGQDFGFYLLQLTCQGRTPGFWSNRNGKLIIEQQLFLARLPLLNLRTANGGLFTTNNYSTYRSWLKGSTAVNMAYKLSAQVVAMDFNLAVGAVNGSCTIQDPLLGGISIETLMVLAVESLGLHGYTPSGHPEHDYQEHLKSALDAANNNQNW